MSRDRVELVGNIELAQRYFDAWNSGDVGTLRELADPQVEFVSPRETAGLEEVLSWFEKRAANGPDHLDVSFLDRQLTEDGATVVSTVTRVYTWKETGEHANSMRVRATLTFCGGKVVKVEIPDPEPLEGE